MATRITLPRSKPLTSEQPKAPAEAPPTANELTPAAQSWLPASPNGNVRYKIARGDTLSGIAKRFGVAYKRIAAANGIAGPTYKIVAGRTLVIPTPKRAAIAAAPPPPPPAAASAQVSLDLLNRRAAADEATVLAEAKALPSLPPTRRPAAWEKLKADFSQWRADIEALTARGALDSAQLKSFTAKVGQAALVQANLPAGAQGLEGPAYRDAARATAARVCWAPTGQNVQCLLDDNPLIGVPALVPPPTLGGAKAKGVATTTISFGGKDVTVRKDVAFVFAAGIVRTSADLQAQQQAAVDAGFAPVLANTGNFESPDTNAQAIADAIRQAKQLVGNPNAKVVLVGYSQGATDILDLMRDASGKYGDLRKDVLAIHAAHSAAGGSQLADLGFALGDYLIEGKTLTPAQKTLVDAADRTLAKDLGLPAAASGAIGTALEGLRKELAAAGEAIRKIDAFAGPVLKKLGLHHLPEEALGKALLGAAIAGRDLTTELQQHGGRWGNDIARLLTPVWNVVLGSGPRELLAKGAFGRLIQRYVDGGLDSVTTSYAEALLADPQLRAHLTAVPILNSSGAVPTRREDELLPPSQRPFYDFFREMGLDADAEVDLMSQMRIAQMPTGLQLPPEASGHWGAQGVVVADETPKYFSAFDPAGWMKSMLTADAAIGLL